MSQLFLTRVTSQGVAISGYLGDCLRLHFPWVGATLMKRWLSSYKRAAYNMSEQFYVKGSAEGILIKFI